MAIYTQYAADQIAMSWRGIELVAPMDGTFITVEFSEDAWELAVGAQGDAAFVGNLDQSGIITVTLQQGSPSNDLLSAMFLEDRLLRTGVGPFMLKDLLGTTLVTAPVSRIQRCPTLEYADVLSGREWPFVCAQIIPHVGSNLVAF